MRRTRQAKVLRSVVVTSPGPVSKQAEGREETGVRIPPEDQITHIQDLAKPIPPQGGPRPWESPAGGGETPSCHEQKNTTKPTRYGKQINEIEHTGKAA